MAASGKSASTKKKTSTAKKNTSTSKKASGSKSGTTAKKSTSGTLSVPSQRSSGSRSSQGNRSGSTASSSRRPSTAKKTAARRSDDGLIGEIIVILLIAVCIFLFCSNLNLCGQVGLAVKNFMRGTLGILGYVFPVYLPIAALYIVLNEEKPRAAVKVAVSAVLYTIFCGLIELIAGKLINGNLEWMEFYHRSLTELGGGLAGGMWCKLLYPFIGLFGSYLVLVVLALIGLVFITGKSLLSPLREGGERMYSNAMEDMVRRREERDIRRQDKEEERVLRRQEKAAIREEKLAQEREEQAQEREERRYRMDHPVRGVAPVSMTPEELERENNTEEIIYTEKPEKSRKSGGEQKSVLGAFTGRNKPKAAEPSQKPVVSQTAARDVAAQELTITGLDGLTELNHQDTLSAKQENRTLSELESLDSLHSGFSKRKPASVPDILYTPDDRLESRPGDGSRIVSETPVIEEDPPVDPTPLTLGSLRGKSTFAQPERKPADRQPVQDIAISFADKNTGIVTEQPEAPSWEENPLDIAKAEQAQTVPAQNARSGDTLRVVTAGGRVIEVDNDPTVDPLAAKRAGRSQGQAAMTNQALVRGEEPAPMKTGEGTSKSSAGYTPGSAVQSVMNRNQAARQSISQNGLSQSSAQTASTSTASSALDVEHMKPKKKLKPYEKPPLRLLNAPQRKSNANRENDLRETAMKLQQTLQNFGVGATVTNISCGPSVTRYELIPDQGVKVSKFLSLTDDIKLNLAAADIRMEAPIPGKSAIGIEVPNKEKTSVCLREVMECEEFLKHPSKLAIAVGKDIAGNTIVSDLARMPHLLVAGTTGSGKSVFVNTMIVSMLYKATPDEVKFIMIDPKMVEFRIYNGIPHLLSPVVTDPKKAAEVLNWAVLQMTDRYKKFAELNVRDIKGYNEKKKADAEEAGEKPELMPQIVIVVDELSDLMMAAPSEVEDAIVRLAQMARAAGIHLILATQRPTVNVVTGLIKANIPSRVALAVANGTDSRTIIDMNGAEKLLGNGDMLFYPYGYQKPLRVQGAFVSDKEILQLVEFLSERGEAQFDESIETRMVNGGSGSALASDRDEYFERAGRFIVESKKASIGNLQRMFKIGFNRAARIMDQLAEVGVVGPEEGTKARKILMTPEEFEAFIHNQ